MKQFLTLITIAVLAWCLFAPQPKAHWSGQLIPQEPVQTTDDLKPAWIWGKNTITPRARYQIRAVVLSKHHYWAGAVEDEIAPYDLVLGWGSMSDAAVLNALKISQGGRWYNYYWKGTPPITPEEIGNHSANNHIVAADRNVLRQIEAIKRYDIVSLRGYLVDFSRPDGWSWHTSMRRDDTAGGACELFWVESVERISQP
jgi:hypothetical protein